MLIKESQHLIRFVAGQSPHSNMLLNYIILYQWRIQLWAVGAAALPPPIDQKLGLVMAARLRHGGKFSLKSLTFGHLFCIKIYKKLSASGGLRPPDPPPGALPLDPTGGSAPRPPFRLALRALAMVAPPLANHGSATVLY